MPRQARIRGNFSIYHIIQRGNERKNIFLSDEDKNKFIQILLRMKSKYDFHIYCYCIMDNHIHLLVYDNGKDISQIIKSINISYAIYYNRKYERVGHLFQDRFKSELIEEDSYLVEVSKYIHNNPVKAGIVKKPEDYLWSSYRVYIGQREDLENNVTTQKVLGCFSEKMSNAIKEYDKYVKKKDESQIEIMNTEYTLEDNGRKNELSIMSMEQAINKVVELGKTENLSLNQIIHDKKKRNQMIKIVREASTLTLKQIGEIFGGLSESAVSKILK